MKLYFTKGMCISAKIGKPVTMQFKIRFYYKAMYGKHKTPEPELHLLFWTFCSLKNDLVGPSDDAFHTNETSL